jgi:hypothetical protein
MSSENSKHPLGFIEVLAILLFIVAIVFIFTSKRGKSDQERELRNAIRFQDVSQIADTIWRISISSTEYASITAAYPTDISCEESSLTTDTFSSLLSPEYFETIPRDPNGEAYKISFIGEEKRITVCSPWGEEEDGSQKLIFIAR